VIVFGRTKHGVKKLAQRLEALGYPAAALQGNLSQNARERVMAGFRSGSVPILLATNVAARGLDVPEVGQVINYELPESPEWFTHRVGRTGRMGRTGRAITLLAPEEAAKWRQFEKALGRKLRREQWVHPGKTRTAAPTATVTATSEVIAQERPVKARRRTATDRGV
jgi:superfamily II DNA/RNA helicase